jgi:hypothetical protein
MAYGSVKVDSIVTSTQTLTADNLVTTTGTQTLTNKTLTAPTFSNPTLTGDVTINAQGDLRLADSDSSHYVALQSPATVTSNVTFTLPGADGTNGQVLGTNGSGVLSFSTPSGGTILYNRRPALHRGPLFSKTAATTISVAAGAVLNGQYYASATAVTMGTHTNNTDMAIWQHPTTGALVSDSSYTTAPAGATGGSIVGGYHYIPSGRPTAFNNGSPTSTAEILEFSIWDLTWRPVCPDPRGMTCVDGRFWCDLYLCGSTSYATTAFTAVPSSKIGLTIADNSSPALIPLAVVVLKMQMPPAPSFWVAAGTTGLPRDHATPTGASFRLSVTSSLALVSRLSTWYLVKRRDSADHNDNKSCF